MFQPDMFNETRIDVMQDLMRAHPFATLVTVQGGGATADHVPLVIHPEASENGVLRGHLAAGNPLCRAGDPGEALAIFQGPQAYISPSWYPSKQAHGKVVPTWNYAVVHARGPLRLCRAPGWLMAHLAALTERHEAARAAPWAVSDAPPDFINRMLRALVGFEIDVQMFQGTWKVSQNKTAQDRSGVITGLAEDGGDLAMSALVAGA